MRTPRCLGGLVLAMTALGTAAGPCTSERSWCAAPCTDEVAGVGCAEELAAGGSCAALLRASPGNCPCSCAGFDASAPPPPPHTGRCTGAAGPTPCFSPLLPWQIDSVVARHNEYRGHHGACPLAYDHEIAAHILGSDGFAATCESGDPQPNADGSGEYGENHASTSTQKELHDWDPAEGVRSWYCGEEACWDYAGSTGADAGRFTQVAWRATTRLGCGLCRRKEAADGFARVHLICGYKTPGNVGAQGAGGQYEANVGSPGTAAAACANAPWTSTPPNATAGEATADPLDPAGNGSECAGDPCPGQDCRDDTGADALDDFVCTCGGNSSVGEAVDNCTVATAGATDDDDSTNDTAVIVAVVAVLVAVCIAATTVIILRLRGGAKVQFKEFNDVDDKSMESLTVSPRTV
ncbi:putative pathogenesis-related protein [Diplonema papillatum]|nr:putative pathogenesis-related protein [Diplonema papillatum]